MKKVFSALCFVIFCGIFNFCYATTSDDVAESYENNPDYYFVNRIQGPYTYLYLPSIDVQLYNPPHYQIKGKFLTIGSPESRYDTSVSVWYATIRYNWYTKEAFEFSNGKWRKMAQGPQSSTPVALDKKIANALFIAAYGMKFYEE